MNSAAEESGGGKESTTKAMQQSHNKAQPLQQLQQTTDNESDRRKVSSNNDQSAAEKRNSDSQLARKAIDDFMRIEKEIPTMKDVIDTFDKYGQYYSTASLRQEMQSLIYTLQIAEKMAHKILLIAYLVDQMSEQELQNIKFQNLYQLKQKNIPPKLHQDYMRVITRLIELNCDLLEKSQNAAQGGHNQFTTEDVNEFSSFLIILSGKLNYDRLYNILIDLSSKSLSKAPVYSRLLENFTKNLQRAIVHHSLRSHQNTTSSNAADPIVSVLYSCCTVEKKTNEPLSILRREVMKMLINPQVFMHLIIHLEWYHSRGKTLLIPTIIDAVLPNLPNDFLNSLYSSNINTSLPKTNSEVSQGDIDSAFVWFVTLKYDINDFIVKYLKTASNDNAVARLANIAKIALRATSDLEGYKKLIPSIVALHLHSPKNLQVLSTHKRFINGLIRKKTDLSVLGIYLDLADTNSKFQIIFQQLFELIRALYQTYVTSAGRDGEIRNFIAKFYTKDVEKSFNRLCNLIFTNFKQVMDHTVDNSENEALIIDTFIAIINISYKNDRFTQFFEELNRWQKVSELRMLFEFCVKALMISLNHCDDVNVFQNNCNKIAALAPKFQYDEEIASTSVGYFISTAKPKFIAPFIEKIFHIYQNFPLESLIPILREYYTSMHSHFSIQFLNYLLDFSKKMDKISRGIIKKSDDCLPVLQAINSMLRIYLENFPYKLSIEPLSYYFEMLIEVNVMIVDMDSQNPRNFKFMANSGTTFYRLLPQIWESYVKNCVATECTFSFIRFLVDETPVTSQNLHFALNFLNSRVIFCHAIYFSHSATARHLKMLPECMDFSYSHIMQLNEENSGGITQLPNHILLEDAKYDSLILNLIKISVRNHTFAKEVGNFLSLLIPNQSWMSRCLNLNYSSNIQPESFLRIIAIHITLNGNRNSEKCSEKLGKQIDLRKTFLAAIETIEYNPNKYLSNYSSYLIAYICMLHFHDKNKNAMLDFLSKDSNTITLPSFCLPFLDADYSPNLSGLESFDPNSLREAAIPSMIFTMKPTILKKLLLLLIIRLVEKSLISQHIISELFQMIFETIITEKTKSNNDVVDHNDSLISCLNLLSLNTPTEHYTDSKFSPNIEWLKKNLDPENSELISMFFTTFFKFFQLKDTSTHDKLFILFNSFFEAEYDKFIEKDRGTKASFRTVIHLLHILSCISYNRNLDEIIAKNKSKFLLIENVALDCIYDLIDIDLNNEDKKREFQMSDNFFKLQSHQVKDFLNLFSNIESRMNLKDLNNIIKKMYTLMLQSSLEEISHRATAWNACFNSNGYIGIINPSNICYMISVVQIIFCTVGNEFYNLKLDESAVRNKFDEFSIVSESEESQETMDKNTDGAAIEKSKPNVKKLPAEECLNLPSYMTNKYCSELVKNFSRFIIDLFESNAAKLSMEGFYSKFIMNQVPIKIDEQNDAMEFFHTLIDSFDTAVSVCHGKNEGKRVFQSNFSGSLRNTTFVESCKHTMKSQEQFSVVGVEVKDFGNLESSLGNFVAKRTLDGYMCDKCLEKSKKKNSGGQKADAPVDNDESLKAKLKNNGSAKRHTMFRRLPKFLTFQLLRFYFDPKSAQISKYNGFFEFPHFLDMDPYISKSGGGGGGNQLTISTSRNLRNRKETVQQQSGSSKHNSSTAATKVTRMLSPYFLRAIVIHSGSATGGHYYAFIKNINYKSNEPQWFKYDDEKITFCNLDDLKILQSECFGDPKIRPNASRSQVYGDDNWPQPIEASDTEEAINRSKHVKKGAYALFYQKYEPELSLTKQMKFLNEEGLESNINISNKCQRIKEQSLKRKYAHSLQRNDFYSNFLCQLIFTERLELTRNNIIQIFTIMSHILIYSKSQTQSAEAVRLFISKLNTAPIDFVIGLANSILTNSEKDILLIFTSNIGSNSPLAAQLLSEILKNIKTRGQMKNKFCPFSFINQVLCNVEKNFNLHNIRNYTLYILIFQLAEDINSFDHLWTMLKCEKIIAFIIQSLTAKLRLEKLSLSNSNSSMLLEQTEASESSISSFFIIHNLLELLIRLVGKFCLQISKQIGQGFLKLHTMTIGKATTSAEELGQKYACLHLLHVFNYLITLTFADKSTEANITFFYADKTSRYNFIQESFACFFNLDAQFFGNIFSLHFLNYLSKVTLWQVMELDPRIDLLAYLLDTCSDTIIKQAILKPIFKKPNLIYMPMMYPDQKQINNKSSSNLAAQDDCTSIFSRLKQLQTLQSSQEIRQALVCLYLIKTSIKKKPELVDSVLLGKKQKANSFKTLVLELQGLSENSSSTLGRVLVAEDKELINYFATYVAKMKKKLL